MLGSVSVPALAQAKGGQAEASLLVPAKKVSEKLAVSLWPSVSRRRLKTSFNFLLCSSPKSHPQVTGLVRGGEGELLLAAHKDP